MTPADGQLLSIAGELRLYIVFVEWGFPHFWVFTHAQKIHEFPRMLGIPESDYERREVDWLVTITIPTLEQATTR